MTDVTVGIQCVGVCCRLAIGLLYLWFCTVALITTLKNPKASYEIQIFALVLLLFLQQRLGLPHNCAVPAWWVDGSHWQLLLVMLACAFTALARASYVEMKLEDMMQEALNDQSV